MGAHKILSSFDDWLLNTSIDDVIVVCCIRYKVSHVNKFSRPIESVKTCMFFEIDGDILGKNYTFYICLDCSEVL